MIKKTFEELRLSGSFPSPSGVGITILQLTQREDVSAEEIGNAIMADATLTGRILKLANSAQTSSIEAITTMPEATMRLGLATVRNTALGLSLLSGNREGVCEAFDYDGYWSRSLARAVAAQSLSERTGVGTPAEAYILGLLSEIGKLALASVYPVEYSQLLAESEGQPAHVLAELEQENFEINHMEVCAFMLEEWGLPEFFQDAVKHFESEPEGTEPGEPIVCMEDLLRKAHHIARAFMAGDSTHPGEWTELSDGLEHLRLSLGLEPEPLLTYLEEVAGLWGQWGGTLKVPVNTTMDIRGIANRAVDEPTEATSLDSTRGPTQGPATSTGGESSPTGAVTDVRSTSSGACDASPTPAPASEKTCGLRILIVDEDPMSCKLLRHMLEKKGHEVRVAVNGDDALAVALESNPQMVLADSSMPGLNGMDFCRALRKIESGRRMYFLLLTRRDEEDRVVQAFDAGVDDYIAKPINPRMLLARIKGGQRVIELQEKVERDRETMRRQVAELGRLTRKLRSAALTDVLTGLPNRRYALKRLEQEWSKAQRTGGPMAMIGIDIDFFKKVNDTYGHDVGDIVLKATADVMKREIRDTDDVCRVGGEEFCVVCGNTTLDGALVCAERIMKAVEANEIHANGQIIKVTLSLGVAQRTADMDSLSALMKAADEAVYNAKHGGRNQVCVYLGQEIQKHSA